eukprot:scaffold59639_cov17-Prasinocladus_malaysianus.AAC.1
MPCSLVASQVQGTERHKSSTQALKFSDLCSSCKPPGAKKYPQDDSPCSGLGHGEEVLCADKSSDLGEVPEEGFSPKPVVILFMWLATISLFPRMATWSLLRVDESRVSRVESREHLYLFFLAPRREVSRLASRPLVGSS